MLDMLSSPKMPGFGVELLLPRSFIAQTPRSKHRNLGKNTRKQLGTVDIAKATGLCLEAITKLFEVRKE
jgi:hypothetical protein